ncbi:MAG TPA: DUF4340 domain-containing protein [Steroidobacteraceae bacterium]|jgi:hypothetical protein
MNRERLSVLAVAALLVLGVAAFLAFRRNANEQTPAGVSLYPKLSSDMASVTSLSVRKGSATANVTVHKQGDRWTVAQRADYPADVSKLRKLLLALTDAKIVEEKTSDPANYAIIGVDDPGAASSSATEIAFTDKDGAHALLVGKSVGDGNFVRRGGDKQSYSVRPGIYVESEPRFWIDAKLIDIPIDSIERIDYKPFGAPAYSVRRLPAPPKAEAASAASAAAPPASPPLFAMDGVPQGRKAQEAQTLAPSASIFNGLTADDVAQAADIDFSKPMVATITEKDGTTVTVTGTVVGDKHWIEIAGIKDAAFSAKSQGRAYELASYRYDGILRPIEQLLVAKEPPPEKKSDEKSKPLPSKSAAKRPLSGS